MHGCDSESARPEAQGHRATRAAPCRVNVELDIHGGYWPVLAEDRGAVVQAEAKSARSAQPADAVETFFTVIRKVKPRYNCSRCGQLKRGHVCMVPPPSLQPHGNPTIGAHDGTCQPRPDYSSASDKETDSSIEE